MSILLNQKPPFKVALYVYTELVEVRGRWDAVRTWFWKNFPVEPVAI